MDDLAADFVNVKKIERKPGPKSYMTDKYLQKGRRKRKNKVPLQVHGRGLDLAHAD